MSTYGQSHNSWRRRLVLPAYSVADAARYTKAHPSTISSWFNRGGRLGPALVGRQKGRPLSYLELVEVAFVKTARELGLRLSEIRDNRNYFRQRFNTEYPFATYRFQTDGHRLLVDLQEVDTSAARGKLLRRGQLAWAELMEARFLEFEYEDDLAIIWKLAGEESPVRIDPRMNFGAPTVRGIPTWAIKGRYVAGEEVEDIQDNFSLDPSEIIAALDFEGMELRAA